MNSFVKNIKHLYVKYHQIILFLSVGAVNTLFGFLLFVGLIFMGLHYAIACLIVTIIGIFFNFCTMGKIVFNNSNPYLIFKYILMNIGNYLLSILFLKLFAYSIENIYINGAIVTFIMAFYTFFISKYYVFLESAYETY